jgi:CheY-like chemotaxis protein
MPNAVAIKVLVVDDQNSVRQMTRMTLEEIGFRHIHEAENGVQAMETASLQPLDLIISDFNMPEMDGLGLLRAVRGLPSCAVHYPADRTQRSQVASGGAGSVSNCRSSRSRRSLRRSGRSGKMS